MTTKINTPKEQGKTKILKDHFIFSTSSRKNYYPMRKDTSGGISSGQTMSFRHILQPNKRTGSAKHQHIVDVKDFYGKKLDVIVENMKYDTGGYDGQIIDIKITGDYTESEHTAARRNN